MWKMQWSRLTEIIFHMLLSYLGASILFHILDLLWAHHRVAAASWWLTSRCLLAKCLSDSEFTCGELKSMMTVTSLFTKMKANTAFLNT